MRRFAVVAHFDARGKAAPHFLRQLDTLGRSFDRLVVATTAQLDDAARQAISARAELIERGNVGQDFASWRDGLELLNFASGADELLLTNDSYVSVIDDLEPMIETMRDRPFEAWGLTKTHRGTEHIQSYFLFFTKPVIDSLAFRDFWEQLRPAASRMEAITTQEMGVSRVLTAAGFRLGSYFEPSIRERRLANIRSAQWLITRRRAFPSRFHNHADYFNIRNWRDPREANNVNWAVDFADFVFDRKRYPIVKFDTLRFDPHSLGSGRLLRDCERYFPVEFEDVRSYIDETAPFYPGRPFENGAPVALAPWQRALYGYRVQGNPAPAKGIGR